MSKGKNKAKAQAQGQEPKAQEPEGQPEAPAITLADIAGMVKGLSDETRQSVGSLGERLTKLETAPAPKAASAPKAKAAAKVAVELPKDAALHALKGICSVRQQATAESHFAKGKVNLSAYIAENLEPYAREGMPPSRAMAYSRELLKHAK